MTTKDPLRTRLSNRETVNPQPCKANSHQDPDTGQPFTAVFTGVFLLTNPLGTYWNDLAQNGALVLSEGANSIVGGNDYVKITADGNAITVPGAWTLIGTTAINISVGAINHIFVDKTPTGIIYAVHVE